MFFKAVCKCTMNGHQHANAVLLWSQSVTQVTGALAAPLWLNCERLACADNQAENGFSKVMEVESCCCLLIKLDKLCQINQMQIELCCITGTAKLGRCFFLPATMKFVGKLTQLQGTDMHLGNLGTSLWSGHKLGMGCWTNGNSP